jgi:hypothetical protein
MISPVILRGDVSGSKMDLIMAAVKTFDEQLLVGIAPGTWVAISPDQERVVATGASIEEAIQKAKEAGEKKQPFIMRVPVENSGLIL